MIKNLVQVVESRFTNERMAALAATLKEVAARAPADYLINPAFVSLRNNSHYTGPRNQEGIEEDNQERRMECLSSHGPLIRFIIQYHRNRFKIDHRNIVSNLR